MEPAPTPSTALLRTRRGLIFTALPAIAVLAVIGGLLAYNHYRSQVEDRRTEAEQLAVAAANNARRFIDDSWANLQTAATSPTIRSGAVPAIEDYLPAVAEAGTSRRASPTSAATATCAPRATRAADPTPT